MLVTKKEEIDQLLPEVLRTADALYVTGSNLVNSQIASIVEIAVKAKVVTITHLEDLVEKGVLLGVCANSYNVGRLSGEKALQVLRGAAPSSVPIETLKVSNVILNMKTAQAGQYQIPPEFMKTVTKKLQ